MMDHPITPALVEGEYRVLDIELAERLKFERPRNIRQLITRWKPELERLGFCHTVQQNTGGRGRPTAAYYLNRKQAIFITAKSETQEATDITIEIIHRFDEYEQGVASPLRLKPFDQWSSEEKRTNTGVIAMYRRVYNDASAAWMMEREGFPVPPQALLPAWRQSDLWQQPPGSVTITVTPQDMRPTL